MSVEQTTSYEIEAQQREIYLTPCLDESESTVHRNGCMGKEGGGRQLEEPDDTQSDGKTRARGEGQGDR